MKIQQIRNATILLDYGKEKVLVDPMLAQAGSIPSLKYFTHKLRRNPLVELPQNSDSILETVTHILITHCQKGHFDHLDRAAIKWIRKNNLPVFCTEEDAEYLRRLRLNVIPLKSNQSNSFFDGKISLVPCLHGDGIIGKFMAHGFGYVIERPNQPSVYVIGDSILTKEIQSALAVYQPEIVVMPAGGAAFDFGGEIIMNADDVEVLAKLFAGKLVVNHLEALDHCPTTRQEIRTLAQKLGLQNRVMVPEDGEALEFNVE